MLPRTSPLARRSLLVATATAALTTCGLLVAAPASAHVTVNPREAPAGGYQKLSLRVPNESPTAGTVAVQVSLPTDTPLASVSVKPHPGWDAQVTRSALPAPVTSGDLQLTEAVTSITWTAQPGVRVGPGQFEEFDLSVGPLPDGVDELVLPAVQTYDDGEVVAWDQVATGGEEAEHPAPTLTLTAATGTHHSAAPSATTQVAALSGSAPVGAADSTDTTARVLGAAGLGVGVLGLGAAAGTTLAQRRRRVV